MDTFIRSITIGSMIMVLASMSAPSFALEQNHPTTPIVNIDSLVEVATQHHKWAAKHYTTQGMLDSVITRAKMALEIREKLWRDSPTVDLGKSYHNLGTFLKFKGEFKSAKEYLNEAVGVFTTLKHDRILRSLLELGKIYRQEGDYISAEEYFQLVIELAEKSKNDGKIRSAVVDLGSVYVDAHRDSDAIDHLVKYSDYFNIDDIRNKDINGKYYNNLASAYVRKNEYDRAVETYQKASLIDKSNLKTQSKIYSNLALTYRLKENYSQCSIALKEAERLAYESNLPTVMSFSHKGWAKYYEALSQNDKALDEYQKAIGHMLPSFTPTDASSNPGLDDLSFVVDKIILLTYLTDKVKVLIEMDKSGNRKEILELFKLGDQLIDDMRSEQFIYGAKLYWRSAVFPFYEEAIKYCTYEKAYYEDAFFFFEKSKSVLLLEGYTFNESILKISDAHMKRYSELKDELTATKSKQGEKNVEEIVNSQRNFELLLDSLYQLYPDLFGNLNKQFVTSLSDFKNEVVKDSSTLFIHYFYGGENVYALGMDGINQNLVNLGPTAKLDSLIEGLKNFFYHPAQIDNNFKAYKEISNQVFRHLLTPLVEENHRDLVIFPDGPIATIPFESLIASLAMNEEITYVIEQRVVRYAFSGSMLSNLQEEEYLGPYDVVTFVPLSESEELKDVTFSGLDEFDFDLAKKNGLKIQSFEGKKASKERLFSFDHRLPILHFSSHGMADEGGTPKILLSNSELSLPELFASSLPADMVFLSACRTHMGENAFGEGVQSLARGFTFAGAKSVVSSLWNVVANPNSKIVGLFYKNLSEGQDKHLALHNAKLSYLKNPDVPLFEKSPYYWAGLVYYGESDRIIKASHNRGNKSVWWVLAAILVAIGAWFSRKRFG